MTQQVGNNKRNLFKSNEDVSYDTYYSTYKNYSAFKIGIAACVVLVAGTAYDIYNMILWIQFGCSMNNILMHVVIAVILLAMLYPAVSYMRSGGKQQLIDRGTTQVSIYQDHITIRSSLTKSEKKKYNGIRTNVYYCDVSSMCYQEKVRRLKIDCEFTVERIPITGKTFDDADVEEVTGKSVYIYDQFDEFEHMMSLIERSSYKKIAAV